MVNLCVWTYDMDLTLLLVDTLYIIVGLIVAFIFWTRVLSRRGEKRNWWDTVFTIFFVPIIFWGLMLLLYIIAYFQVFLVLLLIVGVVFVIRTFKTKRVMELKERGSAQKQNVMYQ